MWYITVCQKQMKILQDWEKAGRHRKDFDGIHFHSVVRQNLASWLLLSTVSLGKTRHCSSEGMAYHEVV